MFRFGPPNYIYRRPGFWGRISEHIPAPLKMFAGISFAAAATVVLAPAIIILAVPPMICGAWLLYRRNKYLSSVMAEMHNQRWQDMASYHLQQSPPSADSQKIPTTAKIAVEKSLRENEQDLALRLGVSSIDQVEFGPLQALAQDFRLGPSGGSEQMSVSEYPLYVDGRGKGIVRVVSRGDQLGFLNRLKQATQNRTRVEVQLHSGEVIVLQSFADPKGDILEGHGRVIKTRRAK